MDPREVAPRAGLEPATLRLTAGCSAIELPRNMRACHTGRSRGNLSIVTDGRAWQQTRPIFLFIGPNGPALYFVAAALAGSILICISASAFPSSSVVPAG